MTTKASMTVFRTSNMMCVLYWLYKQCNEKSAGILYFACAYCLKNLAHYSFKMLCIYLRPSCMQGLKISLCFVTCMKQIYSIQWFVKNNDNKLARSAIDDVLSLNSSKLGMLLIASIPWSLI